MVEGVRREWCGTDTHGTHKRFMEAKVKFSARTLLLPIRKHRERDDDRRSGWGDDDEGVVVMLLLAVAVATFTYLASK